MKFFHTEKEIVMFNKIGFKLVAAFSVLAVLLVFLGVTFVPRISAGSSAPDKALTAAYYMGSDWIERHPTGLGLNYYAGSDWIERHPAGLPANYYAGSDWIERHPASQSASYYAGSDWIERHPSSYYDNSDWIERHPEQMIP
jgi:hypothetical protein